jgi:hypothetical protein
MVASAMLPWLTSCQAVVGRQDRKEVGMNAVQQRFKGIALVLVTDAVPGTEMLGVEFFADGHELPFFAQSRIVKANRGVSSYPGGVVPERVRIVWRKTHETYRASGRIRYRGEIAGDYTIPIAIRVPDAVLQDIRARGGALRFKFRLKPDGVLFGWDIERDGGGISKFDMPGGDFLESRY